MKGFFKIVGLLTLVGGLAVLEHRRPLRASKESKARRNARNLTVATLGALTLHFAESPVLYPLARKVQKRRWGLLKWLRLPSVLETTAAVLLLDYTHYIQHVLHHRIPFLWRFHAVHHVDLDLDTSTALRFHFGEIAISIPYRVAQVFVIGADPRSLIALANLDSALNPVPSLESAAAESGGGSPSALRCNAAHARHSSLEGATEPELELVRRTDDLGCAARHTQLGSPAARHRYRSAGIRPVRPGDIAKGSDAAVSR
jgi:Fatty acid hydroxylase superfamily